MSGTNRSASNAKNHDPCLVQSNECQEQADTDGKAVTQRQRYGIHNPLAQPQDGKDNEQNAGNENCTQRGLPLVAELYADCERDKSVLSHVRRNGKRPVGVKTHQRAAEQCCQNSCSEARGRGNSSVT